MGLYNQTIDNTTPNKKGEIRLLADNHDSSVEEFELTKKP